MPRLCIILLLFCLTSCVTDKKFSGTYISEDDGGNLNRQVIHFTSDSTLQYVSLGTNGDSLLGTYKVVEDSIHIIFNYSENFSKTKYFDLNNKPPLIKFPSEFDNTIWPRVDLEIVRHAFLGKSYSENWKVGYEKTRISKSARKKGFSWTDKNKMYKYHMAYLFNKSKK